MLRRSNLLFYLNVSRVALLRKRTLSNGVPDPVAALGVEQPIQTNPSSLTNNPAYTPPQTLGAFNRLVVDVKDLKPGFRHMHQRYKEMIEYAALSATVPPALAYLWAACTQQMILESVVALSCLTLGSVMVMHTMVQLYWLQQFISLSVVVTKSPSSLEKNNKEIHSIIAGERPKARLTIHGLKVSGPNGDPNSPSVAYESAIESIHAMKHIVISSWFLSPKAQQLAHNAHDRWLVRLSLPFNFFNLVTIFAKKPEERRPDDALVLAASLANIHNFFTGSSVKEARDGLTSALKQCNSPREILKLLIQADSLQEGGMSFLMEWPTDKGIAVTVKRTGSVIIDNKPGDRFTFGGPYPRKLFFNQSERPVLKEEVSQSPGPKL